MIMVHDTLQTLSCDVTQRHHAVIQPRVNFRISAVRLCSEAKPLGDPDLAIEYVAVGNMIVAAFATVPICPPSSTITVHVVPPANWANGLFWAEIEGDYITGAGLPLVPNGGHMMAAPKASKPPEAPCRACRSMNDVGVRTCWSCGNPP